VRQVPERNDRKWIDYGEATALELIDDVGDAHGAVVALAADCSILTARPELYDGCPVICHSWPGTFLG
jgi:hypothetical protein